MTLQATRMRASEMKSRCSVALNSVNISKNRYTDVLPFDNNRVVLDPSAKGYINATFIKISERVSQFIATQGPLPHTFEDFWEMIIQHHCPVIVMLTQLVDNYKADDGPRQFGNICIVTKWIKTSQTSLILRCLEVNYIESKEPPLCVLHIQYPDWPDHGVPKDTLAVCEILKQTSNVPPSLGPIVVHCSAGIGLSELGWFRPWSNTSFAMMPLSMNLKTSFQIPIKRVHNVLYSNKVHATGSLLPSCLHK
ncbi:hypothetical protein K7X08_004610 [Anisodus acutangulus]|uniref:Tyrosine-protein phosphatase domain-containing protein n=1 Tax=Anisodus acutangulus TaxID=402998 RepID=A0A9Q1MHH6_9SOLA|nr:hypothetical protein K7X08_004610 [Anisodus acutangulus]